MGTSELEELRQANYETWETIAPTWAARRDFIEDTSGPVREWMIGALEPKQGQTVLELAGGVSDTGFEAASRVGPNGRVIATDFSPAMVEEAKQRGAAAGLENVEHRVLDAESMDLEDDSVDGVLCRFGYMLMPDPPAALAETRRVLRDGGRLALGVWGPPERNPWLAMLGMALVQDGHMDPPDPDKPGIFHLASEERLRSMLEQAGFSDVRLEEIPVRTRFSDIDTYVQTIRDIAGPLAMVMRGLSDEDLAAVAERVEQNAEAFRTGDGYEVPGMARGAVAS